MASMTITTEKGVNSRYPYVTNVHIIASASSVAGGYKIERFKFSIPKTYSNNPVVKATLANVSFNGNGYYTVLGGASVEAYVAITSSAGSWSTSGATNPGSSAVTIANFKDRGTVTFTTASSGKIIPAFKKNTTNNTALAPGTYYLYLYTKSGSYNERYIDNSGAITLSLTFDYVSYTKCGAPTKVYVRREDSSEKKQFEAFKPGSNTIHVSWEGATAGTSNAIAGYTLYYKLGGLPTTSDYDGEPKKVDSTSTSLTINYSERGKSIGFKVVTRGKVTGYDSSISSGAYGYAKAVINSLPAEPEIYYNADGTSTDSLSSIVKSTNDQITFLGKSNKPYSSPGSDANNSQTTIIKYSINTQDSWEDWENLSEDLVLNLGEQGETTNFYFVTFDGLEFGSIKTISIERNSKPFFNAVINKNADLLYYDGEREKNYTLNPSITISDANKTGLKYTYLLEREIGGAYFGNKFDSLSKILPSEHFPMTNTPYNYKITVTASDDLLEDFSVSLEDNDIWVVPGLPEIDIKNNKDFVDIEAAKYGEYTYFKDWVSIGHQTNTRIAFVSINDETIKYRTSKSDDWYFFNYDTSDISKFPYTNPSDITTGNLFNPTLHFYDSNYNKLGSKNLNKNIKKIGRYPTPLIFESSLDKFKPYNYDEDATWTLNLTRINLADIDLAFYGLKKISIAKVYFFEESKNLEWTLNLQENGPDTISWQGTLKNLYNILPYQNADELLEYPLYITIEDIFSTEEKKSYFNFYINENNYDSKIQTSKIEIDYRETPTITFFQIYSDSLNEGEGYLKQGSSFRVSVTATSYNYNPELELIIKREYDDPKFGVETFSDRRRMIQSDTTSPSNGNPMTYSWDETDSQITHEPFISSLPEIKGDYTATITIKIRTAASNENQENNFIAVEEYTNTFEVKRHIAPQIIIEKAKYTPPTEGAENGLITFNYTPNKIDFGLDKDLENKKIEAKLYYRIPTESYDENSKKINENTTLWETDKSIQFPLNMGNTPSGYIKIEVTTYLSDIKNGNQTIKSIQSNEIAVYNISPTVAYRKNHLGINTNGFDKRTDGVIYIADAPNREFIIFETINGTRTINIKTGAIDNFILDGGNWDEQEEI